MRRNFEINTIGPALVAKHVLPLLPRERRSVFAVLSARVGNINDCLFHARLGASGGTVGRLQEQKSGATRRDASDGGAQKSQAVK